MSVNAEQISEPVSEARILELIKKSAPVAGSDLDKIKLENKGLQHQLEVLAKVDAHIGKVCSLIAGADELDPSVITDTLGEARVVIKDRVKLLRIADQGGWSAVSAYQGCADIGDNPEDSKKIQKAIDSAKITVRKLKFNNSIKANPNSYAPYKAYAPRFTSSTPNRPAFSGSFAPKVAAGFNSRQFYDCYNCGRAGHFSKDCPFPKNSEDRPGTSKQ